MVIVILIIIKGVQIHFKQKYKHLKVSYHRKLSSWMPMVAIEILSMGLNQIENIINHHHHHKIHLKW